KELVALHPDVILAQGTPIATALQRETRTVPIVFVLISDPIGSGFVTSLAKPGGNLTGFALFEPSVSGKWIGMLKEITPSLARVAVLANPRITFDYFYARQKQQHVISMSKSFPAQRRMPQISSKRSRLSHVNQTVAYSCHRISR